MRAQLDRGFEIPHLLLHDGSLTPEDKLKLKTLPNVILDERPIIRHNVPKAVLLGKLECLQRAFDNHGADRAVVFDCDIFFLKNWDADLRKILTEPAVVLRDWGSSIGPNVQQYFELFGVTEDLTTPNCNTGVISILKEDYPRIEKVLAKHIAKPFMMMEDQGAMVAAFHGQLTYVDGIKCVINGAEFHPGLWGYFLQQRGLHLQGMRTRPQALKELVQLSLERLPEYLPLSQFSPWFSRISWGRLEYDHYNFTLPLQKIPSTSNGEWINDGLYLHGGSRVIWALPDRCQYFSTTIRCMDTGIPTNVQGIKINGKEYRLGASLEIPLNGSLEIETQDGPGTHLVFQNPRLHLNKKSMPDLSLQVS